jgi:hypothetical protein
VNRFVCFQDDDFRQSFLSQSLSQNLSQSRNLNQNPSLNRNAASSGELAIAFEPLPDNTSVDYGANLKVVRSSTTGIYRFKPMNDGTQCEGTSSLLVTQVPLRQSTNSSPPSLAAQSPLCSTWTLADTCRSGS